MKSKQLSKPSEIYSEIDRFEILTTLKKKNISQQQLASKLRRSQSSISFAMQGKRPQVFRKIIAYLETIKN